MARLPEVGLEAVLKNASGYVRDVGRMRAANTGLNRSLGVASRGAAQFQRVLSTAAKFSAVAVAAGVGASIKTFIDFDSAMTKSIAIMGDVSDALRDDMEEAARDVAKTTTFSMEQAAEAYFFLASAGLDAVQSIAALPQVSAFAQAGAFDLALATDLLTDAQSALGLVTEDTAANVENMARVSDVLVKANTLANASVQQFSTALTREAGAALKAFNIDVEEGVAVLAAFADQGVKGELAGTSLSRILRLMTSAAVNNAEAYEQLNIRIFDANGNINNLGDIVGDLENSLGGMSDETRVAALEALGFQARVQGVILPLLGTSDAIAEYESNLRKAGGTTQDVAEKQLTSLGAQLSLLRSGFTDVLFTIGQELEPGLRALVATLREDVIPAIESGLPVAIEKAKEIFEDWESTIDETLDIVKEIFSFIFDNQAALVIALALIGAAMIAAFPHLAIASAAAGIIVSIALLRGDLDKMGESALEARGAILKFLLTLDEGRSTFLNFLGPFGVAADFALDLAEGLDIIEDPARRLREELEENNAQLDKLGRQTAAVASVAAFNAAVLEGTATTEDLNTAVDDLASSQNALVAQQFALQGALQLDAQAADVANRAFADYAAQLRDLIGLTPAAIDAQLRLAAATLIAQTAFIQGAPADRLLEQLAVIQRIRAEIDAMVAAGPGGAEPPPPPNLDFLSDAVEGKIEEIESAWERGAREWMEAVVQGVRDGTVTFQDAVDNLAIIGSDGFQTIIDELAAKQTDIERVWEIIVDTIERGFVRIQDVAELRGLGLFGGEVADDFINALLGAPWADIAQAIEAELVKAAEEAAQAFADELAEGVTEAFEQAAANVESILAGFQSQLGGLLGAPTQESAAEALRMAEIRLALLELEEQVLAIQEARTEAIAEVERELADIREAGAERIAQLEESLEGLRAREEREVAVLESQVEELRETEKERVDDLNDRIKQLRRDERDQVEALGEDIDSIRKTSADRVEQFENDLEAVRTRSAIAVAELEDELAAARIRSTEEEEVLQDRLNAAKERGREVDKNLATIQREVDRSQARVLPLTLKRQLEEAEAEKAQHDQVIADTESELEAAQDANDAEIQAIRDRIEAVKEASKVEQGLIRDRIDAEKDATRERIEGLREEIDTIRKANRDRVEGLQDEIELIREAADAEAERLKANIDFLEDFFDKQEERIRRNIEAEEEAIEAAEAKTKANIEFLNRFYDRVEERITGQLKLELDALEKSNKKREIERDILRQRGILADINLKTDKELLEATEDLIKGIAESTAAFDDLDEILQDIADDTFDVLDAFAALELGLEGLSEFIIRRLAGIQLSALDALLLAQAGAGGPFEELFASLARQILESLAGFQEGGFIPAGQAVPAMLHGPELVVPLGGDMDAMSRALASIGAPVGGGGFVNYGQQTFVTGTSDEGRETMRGIRRALVA